MGPFLTFSVLELQRGYLYQNGVEFHQKLIGAGLNLFWPLHIALCYTTYPWQGNRKVIGKNGTMSDSGAI